VGFWSNGRVKKVTLGAGAAVDLVRTGSALGYDWSPDHKIFIAHFSQPLFAITETGAGQQVVATADPKLGEDALFTPEVLPGGKGIILQKWSSNPDNHWAIVVQSFASGQRKVLVNNARYGRYALTGHLVYEQDGSLFAVPFDQDKLELTGTPVRLPEKVATYQGNAIAMYSIADNGTPWRLGLSGPEPCVGRSFRARNSSVDFAASFC
jgi:hypothetical protein